MFKATRKLVIRVDAVLVPTSRNRNPHVFRVQSCFCTISFLPEYTVSISMYDRYQELGSRVPIESAVEAWSVLSGCDRTCMNS